MRRSVAISAIFGAVASMTMIAQDAFAQHPKGIVICLAACSKSDKGCQDQCLPRGLSSGAKACVETCRQRAAEPDLVVEMTRCVSSCLGAPTQ